MPSDPGSSGKLERIVAALARCAERDWAAVEDLSATEAPAIGAVAAWPAIGSAWGSGRTLA